MRRRPSALCVLLALGRTQAYAYGGAQSTAWSDFFHSARPTAGFAAGRDDRFVTQQFDLGALLRATRTAVAERLGPWRARFGVAWSRRGIIALRARERFGRSWAWLRMSTSPPVLRARGEMMRHRGEALVNRTRRAFALLKQRLAIRLPIVARQLRSVLAELAAELGVLPLLHGADFMLRGLVLLGGRFADHVRSHYQPPAAGECTFRSAGAFERHFALDASVLEARRATTCQALKQAARRVLITYHPDKLAVTHPGCSPDLSDKPMQLFLVDYADSKARLCGR